MADVASTLRLWSKTASSNSPSGTTAISGGLDDNLQQIQATIRQYLASPATTPNTAAATVNLAAADGYYVALSGSTTITSFGTEVAGISYVVKFTGAPSITHNATSLILPGGASITAVAGDCMMVYSEGSGNWRCLWYLRNNFPIDGKVTVASAASPNIFGAGKKYINYTGTTTATGFSAAPQAGLSVTLYCAGACAFTAGANLLIPGYASGETVTMTANDIVNVYAHTTTQFVLTVQDVSGIQLQTAVASTSGTSIDFTDIPSNVKKINVMFVGVSVSGSSIPMIQIGDGGGIEVTGYSGAAASSSAGGNSLTAMSTGFLISGISSATYIYTLVATLYRQNSSSFTWCMTVNGGNTDSARIVNGGGSKSLSAALDRVRITTVNGTDTFDAGEINISYEM